jgi:hypothetical protein
VLTFPPKDNQMSAYLLTPGANDCALRIAEHMYYPIFLSHPKVLIGDTTDFKLQMNLCIEAGIPIVSSQGAVYKFIKIFFYTFN